MLGRVKRPNISSHCGASQVSTARMVPSHRTHSGTTQRYAPILARLVRIAWVATATPRSAQEISFTRSCAQPAFIVKAGGEQVLIPQA